MAPGHPGRSALRVQGERARTALFRLFLNFFPAFRASGARITYLGDGMKHVRLELPLRRRTRNYVGTIYGGSMYSAVDGIYMVMLIKALGKGYVVWDKSGTIRYRKPAKETLYAEFVLRDDVLDEIRAAAESQEKVDREFAVNLVDAAGTVHAEIGKTIQIRKRSP
jgi:acyl-coenzyme A thioesterase PaaI-like protein